MSCGTAGATGPARTHALHSGKRLLHLGELRRLGRTADRLCSAARVARAGAGGCRRGPAAPPAGPTPLRRPPAALLATAGSSQSAAANSSSTWAGNSAPRIGALRAGFASSHATATCAGVRSSSRATSSSTLPAAAPYGAASRRRAGSTPSGWRTESGPRRSPQR